MKRILLLGLLFAALSAPAQTEMDRRNFAELTNNISEAKIYTEISTTQLVFEAIEFNSDFAIENFLSASELDFILLVFDELQFSFICYRGPGYYRCIDRQECIEIINEN